MANLILNQHTDLIYLLSAIATEKEKQTNLELFDLMSLPYKWASWVARVDTG